MINKHEHQKIIQFDLELLKDCFITGDKKDFDYHYKTCMGNLKDYFKIYDELQDKTENKRWLLQEELINLYQDMGINKKINTKLL